MTPPARRWNDQAIDGLKDEVDDVKHELVPLKELPTAVAALTVGLEAVREAQRRADERAVRAEQLEERRVSRVYRRLDEWHRAIEARFDKSDEDHRKVMRQLAGASQGKTPARGDWKTVLAGASAFTIPAATLIIYALERGGG